MDIQECAGPDVHFGAASGAIKGLAAAILRTDKALDRLEEAACDGYRLGGACGRHANSGSCLVVRDGLELIAAAKEGAKLKVEVRIVLYQPSKLALHGCVLLEYAAVLLKKESLRGVQSGKVGRSSGVVVQSDAMHRFGLHNKLTSLFKKLAGLVEKGRAHVGEPVELPPAVRHVSQEDRDVVVGIRSRVTARARAVED